jgi:hypothetical protein
MAENIPRGRIPTERAMSPDLDSLLPSALALISGRDALLLAGVVLLTTSLLRIAHVRRQRSRQAERLTPEEMLERNRQMRGMQGDMEQLMTEVEQLARRFSAQLDAKSRRLERLTAQADERIEALLKLQDPSSPIVGGADALPSRQAAATRRMQPSTSFEEAATVEEDQSADPLAASVYDLADQGLSAEQIARKLGEHAGKVELIMALRTTA